MPDTSKGKVTPVSTGIITRASQAVQAAIKGAQQAWFGPLDPVQPMAPEGVAGRKWDYPQGVNLNYNPRSYESVSFEELRALAENCDVLRAVIETRKDQLESLDWNIKIKIDAEDPRADATDDQKKRIETITKFFEMPDKRNSWSQWLRMWMEDMFVLDAACFYKRRDRVGRLWGLEPVDGATVKVIIDNDGRTPLPPEPAYQQILHGIPAANFSSAQVDEEFVEFTSDELLYLVRNPRTFRMTGYSHVQQVLITANIFIRRAVSQLEFYQQGTVPAGWLMAPEGWNSDQIEGFQKYLDALLSGNLAELRKVRVIPKSEYKEIKPVDLKDEFDEWLTRIVCYVFSVSPTPFVKQVNRATAESQHEQALEEGLAPLQKYIRQHLNRIIAVDFGSPDLQFEFLDDREQDPQVVDQILVNDVKSGIISIDEARESKGMDPLGGAYAVAQALLGTGYVAPTLPEEQAAQRQQTMANQTTAVQNKSKNATGDEDEGSRTDDADGGQVKPENVSVEAEAKKLLKSAVKKKSSRLNPYLSREL